MKTQLTTRLVSLFAISFLTLTAYYAFAQNCDKSLLEKKPGAWKEGIKGSTNNVTAANLAKEKEVVQSILSIIKEGYSPVGCEVTHTGFFGYNAAEGKNWVADPYGFRSYFLRYLCDPNDITKSYVDISTPTILSISVNQFTYPKRTIYAADLPDDHEVGYIMVQELPQYKNGYYYWESKSVYNPNSNYNSKLKNYYWLIVYNNKLPFVHVTQKEYLMKTLASFKSKVQEINENEARKKANFAGFSDEDRESYDQQRSYYSPAIKLIEGFLKTKSEAELSQPAVILHPGDMQPMPDFVPMGTPGADILIKPNPGYYDQKLPKHTPQLFSINLTIEHSDPVFEHVYEYVGKAINIQKFKAMLGETFASEPKPADSEIANTIIVSGASSTGKMRFNPLLNEPTKGFVPTPLSQIKNAAITHKVTPTIKTSSMAINMTAANRQEILKKLLYDIQKNLTPSQLQEIEDLSRSAGGDALELADMGVLLYYKGLKAIGFWCLAQAASFQPDNDYILNNLTGILNMGGAAPRSLPILRYLVKKYPNNSTVLNNLGQAWYAMGELQKSKAVLDSCLRISPHHPQANYTRAAIAEKEGKNGEAAAFIQKSLKGAYNDETENFARKKGVKIDWGNTINRKRPTDEVYVNPLKFRPPPQCENENTAGELEGLWQAWSIAVEKAVQQVEGGLEESSANYEMFMEVLENNPDKVPAIPSGIISQKASLLYKVYLEKLGTFSEEANNYFENKYEKEKQAIEIELEEAHGRIRQKYATMEGEGKGSFSNQRCAEINQASNQYLQKMASLNNDFNDRFAEPIRLLQIELMYWSLLLPEPSYLREMKYYQHALFAVQPLLMPSEFIYPCEENKNLRSAPWEEENMEVYCPISFKIKIIVIKVTGDCSKFELEVEAGGLLAGFERDFVNKKSTIAFGAGASLDLKNENSAGISQNVKVPGIIPEFVDVTGAGVGVKLQGFVEIGPDGVISDGGMRMEGSLEGALTDKGDIKIGGKIGVNSGVQVTTSQAADTIIENINGLLTTSN